MSAGLTALQTFLRLSERAEQYREGARVYASLRRDIEKTIIFMPESRGELEEKLGLLSSSLDEAARGRPNVSRFLYQKATLEVKGESRAGGLLAIRLRLAGIWRP